MPGSCVDNLQTASMEYIYWTNTEENNDEWECYQLTCSHSYLAIGALFFLLFCWNTYTGGLYELYLQYTDDSAGV